MTEHVCEWEWIYMRGGTGGKYPRCTNKECGATLSTDEHLARLNATEMLSAKQAEDAASNSECHMHDRCVYEKEFKEVQATIDALQAYADMLEA